VVKGVQQVMENKEVVMQALEQVQGPQEQLQGVLEDQSPPHDLETHQNSTCHQNQSHGGSRAC
jgi:hypothetical protein